MESYSALLKRKEDLGMLAPGEKWRAPSTIGRHFMTATEGLLASLNSRSLAGLNLAVIMVDGTEIGDNTVVWAQGITMDGIKIPLGLVEHDGKGEPADLVAELWRNLDKRGLDMRNVAWSVDGGPGLAKSIQDFTLGRAAIQRCRIHKKRNILDNLPSGVRDTIGEVGADGTWREWEQADFDEAAIEGSKKYPRDFGAVVTHRLWVAWDMPDYGDAVAGLEEVAAWLKDLGYDESAGSVLDDMADTLLLQRLRLNGTELREKLKSTNGIESANAKVSNVADRPASWDDLDGDMRSRWCAFSLMLSEIGWLPVTERELLEQLSLGVVTTRYSPEPDWAIISDTGSITVTRLPAPSGHERGTYAAVWDLIRWADINDKVVEIDEAVLEELATAETLKPWLARCGFTLDPSTGSYVRGAHEPGAADWARVASVEFPVRRIHVPRDDVGAASRLTAEVFGPGAGDGAGGGGAVCIGSDEALGKLGLAPGQRLTFEQMTSALQGRHVNGDKVRFTSPAELVDEHGVPTGANVASVTSLAWELELPYNVMQRWREADPTRKGEIEAALRESVELAVKKIAQADDAVAAIAIEPDGAKTPRLRVRGVVFGVLRDGKLLTPLTRSTEAIKAGAAAVVTAEVLEAELARLGPPRDLEQLRVVPAERSSSPEELIAALGERRGGWLDAKAKEGGKRLRQMDRQSLVRALGKLEDPFEHLDFEAAAQALQWERQLSEAQAAALPKDRAGARAMFRVEQLEVKLNGLRESEHHPELWGKDHAEVAWKLLALRRELARPERALAKDPELAALLEEHCEVLGERRTRELGGLAEQRMSGLSDLSASQLGRRLESLPPSLESVHRSAAEWTLHAERTVERATRRIRAGEAEVARLEGLGEVELAIFKRHAIASEAGARDRAEQFLLTHGRGLDEWMDTNKVAEAERLAVGARLRRVQRDQARDGPDAQRAAEVEQLALGEPAAVGVEA